MLYGIQWTVYFDAASPEPEVVVMVDHNLESSCDDEQYSSMHSHVIPPPLLCDSHVTDPINHLYNTVDTLLWYYIIPCRLFYTLGWVTATGGGITIKRGSVKNLICHK